MRGAGPAVEVDTTELWKAISHRLFHTSKTALDVADLLGFSSQIFSDLKAEAGQAAGRAGHRNYQPSAPIFITICWWLGADPRDFYRVVRPVAVPPTPSLEPVTLFAPTGCDDCSVEPGEPHRHAGCPGNVRALAAYNAPGGVA